MWIIDYYEDVVERKGLNHEKVIGLIRAFSNRGIGNIMISEIRPEYSEAGCEIMYTVRLYQGYAFRRFYNENAAMIAYFMARTRYYSVQIREEETEHDEEIDTIRCAACRDR